jgi:hypothetical protein
MARSIKAFNGRKNMGGQPTGFGGFTADTRTGFDKAVASFASGPRVGAVYQPDGGVNRITTLSNMQSISPYEQTRSDNASRETNARYIPDQITTKDYKGNDGSITAETEYAKAKERIEKSPASVRFAGANGVEVLGGGDNKDAAVAGAREAARMAKLDIADFKFSVLKAPKIENGLKP